MNGIKTEQILYIDYKRKQNKNVSELTIEFLHIGTRSPLRQQTTEFPLSFGIILN